MSGNFTVVRITEGIPPIALAVCELCGVSHSASLDLIGAAIAQHLVDCHDFPRCRWLARVGDWPPGAGMRTRHNLRCRRYLHHGGHCDLNPEDKAVGSGTVIWEKL